MTQRFFGRSVSLEEIVPIQIFDDYYDYIVIDDMVCFVWGDGETYNNMTIVKDIYNLGDGMMQVGFNIYSIDIGYYNLVNIGGGIKDKNVYYYTQTDAEIHPAFKFHLSGIAIINPDALTEGKKYQLISYELISEDVASERIEIMD